MMTKTPDAKLPKENSKKGTILRVKRVRSAIRRPQKQKDTLRTLGLSRMNKVRELPDTPSIRGMVNVVAHLVHIENDKK